MCTWDKYHKPPAKICPQKYCFLWHDNSYFTQEVARCREPFGPCRRSTKNPNHSDWYKPCEPELEKDDLPWFYFITNADFVDKELRNLLGIPFVFLASPP